MNIYDDFDIIIEGGQSNADGSGTGPVCAFEKFKPSPEILYLTPDCRVTSKGGLRIEYLSDNFSIDVAEERVVNEKVYGDLALTFAEDYVRNGMLKNGRKLLIVRGAIGGTSFNKNHWGLNGTVYTKMIEMTDYAMGLNPKNRIVAFLWHQGESETNVISPAEYRKCLEDTLGDVRRRYGEMPFVAGDFVQEWIPIRGGDCKEFAEVYRKFVSDHKKAAFVETDGLLSNHQKIDNGDHIHFCREALYELGHRYYDAFVKII